MLRSVIHMSGWKSRLWNSLETRRRCSSRDPFYSRGLTCSVYWFWFIACVILWRNIAWISFTWRAASGYSIDTMLTWKEQLIDYMRSRIVSLLTHTLPFLAPSNQNIQRSERRKAKVDRDHFFLSFGYMNCSSSVAGCIRESSIAKSLKVTELTEDA